MDEKGDVLHLPVKRRDGDVKRVLTAVRPSYSECQHKRFTIDERLAQVECRDCGVVLNPMFALLQLARQENQYHDLHMRYQDEMKRLGERSRTKCEHCSKMTRISRS